MMEAGHAEIEAAVLNLGPLIRWCWVESWPAGMGRSHVLFIILLSSAAIISHRSRTYYG